MDVYGHVNNVAVMRLLEDARLRTFWAPHGPLPPADADEPIRTLVVSHNVRYLKPVEYRPGPIFVDLAILRVGGASFEVDYVLRSAVDGQPHVRAKSTIALVDAATGALRRIDAALRVALAAHLDA
jgi:acyl-CoA thioester hydrolase